MVHKLLDTVVHTETDALHLLFDATLRQSIATEHASDAITEPSPEISSDRPARGPSESAPFQVPAFPNSANTSTDNPFAAGSDGLLKELPKLDLEQITLWSRFPPCIQRFLNPAEVVAYLD